MLPKQPPVHMLNVRPAHYLHGDRSHELAKNYAKYGFNSFYMRAALIKGGHDYESEKKREKDPFDRFSSGYVGDGYHNTTRYGELEEDEARKTSLGVVMRNWVSISFSSMSW